MWTAPRPRVGLAAGAPALDSEKLQAVRDFLESGDSVSAAARAFKTSRATIRAVRNRTNTGLDNLT